MSMSYEEFVKRYPDCEPVGGDVQCRIDGKAVTVAYLRGSAFSLTEAGEAMVAQSETVAQPAAPRRGRPPKSEATE